MFRAARGVFTFSVLPSGPIILCRRFTNLSLFRTKFPILMMSQATLSSKIFTACPTATPLASSLTISRALKMMYGSYVFRVVRTDMDPLSRSNVHAIPCRNVKRHRSPQKNTTDVCVQRPRHGPPCFAEILLSVFREQRCKRRFGSERPRGVVVRLECLDMPLGNLA